MKRNFFCSRQKNKTAVIRFRSEMEKNYIQSRNTYVNVLEFPKTKCLENAFLVRVCMLEIPKLDGREGGFKTLPHGTKTM